VVTGAVGPPASEHAAVVGVVGPAAVVGDELVVGVVVTGASVVAVVDGAGVDVVAALPLPPPHEARIRANAVIRKPYRRTQHHGTTGRFRRRTGTIPAT
jgi:hypothetical protein